MLRLIDGFDHESTNDLVGKWTTWNALGGASIVTGRFTGSCLRMAQGSTLTRTFDNQATWVVGFALRVAATPQSPPAVLLALRDATTNQVDLRLDSINRLVVTRNGTTLATSTQALSTSTWYYIELKATIGASGSYDLHLNGTSILSGTSVNTQASGNAYANTVFVQSMGSQFTAINTDIDDLYIADGQSGGLATFAGDVRVATFYPTVAGDRTEWTPNTAVANYTTVDESTPNGDTDYVSSSTTGQVDIYKTTASLTGSPVAVAVNVDMRKDDAAARTVSVHVKSGTTEADGTAVSVPAAYAITQAIWETDPNTSAAWTAAAANALQFGAKVVS